MSLLERIFDGKRHEVAQAKSRVPEALLKQRLEHVHPPRGFRDALLEATGLALIAEVKKASPSQGLIRADFNPVEIAKTYQSVGADCLSILTDAQNFQGSLENLRLCREATELPCLRKDFIFDPYQILEARAFGADAILLIVAMLPTSDLMALQALAKSLGMDVLVEVHTEVEAETALAIGADLIGVNNRNLEDFKTDLGASDRILPMISGSAVAVSESALESRADLDRVQAAGAKAVLIGTTFCSAPNIASKVNEVMGW